MGGSGGGLTYAPHYKLFIDDAYGRGFIVSPLCGILHLYIIKPIDSESPTPSLSSPGAALFTSMIAKVSKYSSNKFPFLDIIVYSHPFR